MVPRLAHNSKALNRRCQSSRLCSKEGAKAQGADMPWLRGNMQTISDTCKRYQMVSCAEIRYAGTQFLGHVA